MPEIVTNTLRTAVRCRPLTANEKNNAVTRIVKITGDQISLHNPISGTVKEHNFSYDSCYASEAKTNELYRDIAEPLLGKSLEGYNVAILAYGGKACGKSFTVHGTHEESGLVTIVSQTLFNAIKDSSSIKNYFVTVSYLEVGDEFIHDLINPSGHNLKIRNHPQLGLYVDDLAEVEVTSSDDVVRYCDQGNRIKMLSTSDMNNVKSSTTILSITIEQKPLAGNSKGSRSVFSFVSLCDSEHTSKSEDAPYVSKNLNSLSRIISALNKKDSEDVIPCRDSNLTRLLQNCFGGNSFAAMIGLISPIDNDYEETLSTLKFITACKNITNKPKKNENDASTVLKTLRDEITHLRERVSSGSTSLVEAPNSDDVVRMEELIKDLQVLKMQTWEEKQRISAMFLEERQHHLSNKGILDMVQDSKKGVGKDIDANLSRLSKDKERMMLEYKDKRAMVDELKDKLQVKITDYTKITEQGKGNEEEGKKAISQIQEMKEKLKQENENLKKIKSNLKENQDQQKTEKEDAKMNANALKGNMELRFKLEVENREKQEKENQATLADEVDRIKMETEQEKAELKLRKAEGKSYSIDDMIKVELELLDLKAEKAAMAIKLRSMEEEKKQLHKDVNELFKRQKEELEIQQLQHLQTFRVYRETFEDQKAALEQRYRSLLEDSIQDAVYLSSTHQELLEENQMLKQEMAEMKDKVAVLAGRPTSAE